MNAATETKTHKSEKPSRLEFRGDDLRLLVGGLFTVLMAVAVAWRLYGPEPAALAVCAAMGAFALTVGARRVLASMV